VRLLFLPFLVLSFWAIPFSFLYGQGSPEKIKSSLQQAMLKKDLAEIDRLWGEWKKFRGKELGRADSEVPYSMPDTAEIDFGMVEKIWDLALDQFMTWEFGCPELSTDTPLQLLGICLAQKAKNQPIPKEKRLAVAQMLECQQFKSATMGTKTQLATGSFGWHISRNPDSCGFTGATQKFILSTAKKYPEWTVRFEKGGFAGYQFLVSDQGPGMEKVESPMSGSMYWALEVMFASFDWSSDSLFWRSALEAGNWMLKEEPGLQIYQNARLTSGLALLYERTGNQEFKQRMNFLLRYCLFPAVLSDENGDGMVDGTPILLDSLVPYGKVPGRIWEGNSASSWNQAICGLAILKAVLAFEKWGNLKEARRWKSVLESMLDNQCTEILSWGLPPAGTGFRDLAYFVFEAFRCRKWFPAQLQSKIKKARIAVWNAGVLKSGGTYTLNLGQMIAWD
jgi:hypothetical protein